MATLEGTITKHKRKPNLLNDFIDAMENGNNTIILEAGHLVVSEYEDWAKENNVVTRQSNFLANLNEDNEIVSYSMPTYGYSLVERTIDENNKVINTTSLLKTYNYTYFLIDSSQNDMISTFFKVIGLRNSELEKDSNTSTNYTPYLSIGIISKELLNKEEETIESMLKRHRSQVKYDRESELNIEDMERETVNLTIDLRDLDYSNPYYYIVITNIESGDFWENPNFNPNTDTEPAFIPLYTCSAPDLIDIQSVVFNKAPTIPTDIKMYHNGDKTLYTNIPNNDLIEGIESCLEWKPSIDLDETPELDTLNMGRFVLPVSLSRGDIDKDGKISQEDLDKLKRVINNEEDLNNDGYGMWAAIISELGSLENNTSIDIDKNNNGIADTIEILEKHLDPNSEIQIKSDTYEGEDWESEWNVDVTNNLYYIDIEDERITPEVKIELYNEYLYNLGTFKKIQCHEGSFRIYVSCCPTGGLFTQENYDGEQLGTLLKEKWEKLKEEEFLKVEYKIIAENYKNNILRKSKDENIVYEVLLDYNNEDYEKYWILPKDKDYLDIPFIQDLYYEYCKIYSEREAQENKNKFLKLLPKKALVGYEKQNNKLIAILPAFSEEEQFLDNIYMFKTKLNKISMASIDYYGMKSRHNTLYNLNKKIHYLNNKIPSIPSKVIFQQNKNNITLIGTGSFDEDTNINYKKPAKDLIRYNYEYYNNKKNEFIEINYINNIKLPEPPRIGLGDFTSQGKINDLSLIRLSAYIYGNFIPSREEAGVFEDLTGEGQINQNDIDLLKKYINTRETIILPGLSNYSFRDPDMVWAKIPELGLYRVCLEIDLPNETSPVSIYFYNNSLYEAQTFVQGEIVRNDKKANVYLYFKVPPIKGIELNYSIQTNNYGDEVKLYKYTQWYPTPITFSINKQPDEVEYIKVRARATDRMAWSGWKEFEGVAYPDIWLGVRNYIGKFNFKPSGGGNTPSQPDTTLSIPSPVSDFRMGSALNSNELVWTNPIETCYYETVIVQKIGSKPTSISDGDVIYRGSTKTSVIVSNIDNSKTTYWAAFAINKNNEYNENYPIVYAAFGGLLPDPVPQAVSNFVVNGVDYTANLSWTNPTDDTYYETVK